MRVQSLNVLDVQSIESIWSQTIPSDFEPTLAICFCDAMFDFRTLSEFLVGKNIEIIGATTCGEITGGSVYEKSCSIMVMDMDKDSFEIYLENFDDNEELTSEKVALKAKARFSNPAIITYASKLGVNGDRVVKGFKNILEKNTPIFGGLAGDNFRNEEFTVFHNDRYNSNGLLVLLIDNSKVKVEGKSYSGWKPLGKTHTATKAEGNVIFEIDGLPALDLFIEYFGIEQSRSEYNRPLEQIPGMYPIKVLNEPNKEYMRSPLFYDKKNKSLTLAGEIKQGERIKFCPMPDIDTVQDTVDFFRSYSQSIPNVDAVLINSCAGRQMSFGPMMDKEVNEIYHLWNKPTIGFMALGEIGNNSAEGECNFHNVTLSLVTLTKL